MLSASSAAFGTAGQSAAISLVLGVLSASVVAAVVTTRAGRYQQRRAAHHAALTALRDCSLDLVEATMYWGQLPADADEGERLRLDVALVIALARFEWARAATPSTSVNELAAQWRDVALAYHGGDEATSFDQEQAVWRRFARRWGEAIRDTY